jgi:site-specific recombinase XerD
VGEVTLATLKTRYLEARAHTLRPGSVLTYGTNLDSLLRFLRDHYPGVTTPAHLKRHPHIEGWLRSLATRHPPYANATRLLRIITVRCFLQDIEEWGWTRAPTATLLTTRDVPPRDRFLPRPLSLEVDTRLQEELRAQNDLVSKGLLLARFTGLRIGEVTRLDRHCLDGGAEGPWSIRVPLGKLHNERFIPVDDDTRQLVQAIRCETAERPATTDPETGRPVKLLLCDRCGRRLCHQRVRNRLKQVATAAGIQERVHPHRLRHTYATEMLRFGVSLVGVMKLLGHRSPKTEAYLKARRGARERYGHLDRRLRHTVTQHARADLFGAFDDLIARIQLARFDDPDPAARKALQRLVETLRRAQTRLSFLIPSDDR